jgi:hypothetical protein
MGQYYITVNVDKKQYLHPHKFGNGLKLMEFSSDGEGIAQALMLLLAHSNNRGGGDLHTENKLIGSWAGDRIVVAGDYDDDWLFVPDEYKDTSKHDADYGKRLHHDNSGSYYGETLYSTAKRFFKDISDDIIREVAKSGSPYHPWAAMDMARDGWRKIPSDEELDEYEPVDPAGGQEAFEAYKKYAERFR